MAYTNSLDKISRKNIKQVGGKAANLGEMMQAGLTVPGGFVVTTEAYKAFSQPFPKGEAPPGGNGTVLYDKVLRDFDKLGAARVAVRSSAVAEDSADASWAGQLESYLNVTRSTLVETIAKCWQSIGSNRAQHYASKHNVKQSDCAVAVVVQKMIDSELSGVMFTANPVSGDRNEIMIEAVYGLGEMIVQGITTPESIIFNRETRTVTSRTEHRQTKKLMYKDGKNAEVPLLPELQNKIILTTRQIEKLITLAEQIENYFNSPQDIEWAFAGGKFYVVQSRPITTALSPQNSPISNEKRKIFLEKANDIFRWGPIRGYYFYISDYAASVCHHLHKSYKNEYFPETLLLFNNEHMVWLSDFEKWQKSGKGVFKKYIENPEILDEMKNDWEKAVADLKNYQITIIPATLKNLNNKEFIDTWQTFYQKMMDFWVPTLLPELGNYGAPELLKEDLKKIIHNEEELIRAQEILTAPEELSFYQEEEFQLVETTNIIAHHAKYFWLKNSYGHVEVLKPDFFKDRQSKLIAMSRPLSQSELKQKVKTSKQGLQKQYNLPGNIIKRAQLISENIVWQDKRKRIMSENFHYKKILLEELARRTGKSVQSLLNHSFDEALSLLKGKQFHNIVAYHGIHFNTAITRLAEADAKYYWEKYAHHKTQIINSIKGIVASTGKKSFVNGRVRVLSSSHDILKPGEILVTAMTSPGYVFAMRHAAAVVTDIGGLTSHAAIVAREIGVPCIVGTKIASRVLKTGDEVKIDTLRGIIRLTKEK